MHNLHRRPIMFAGNDACYVAPQGKKGKPAGQMHLIELTRPIQMMLVDDNDLDAQIAARNLARGALDVDLMHVCDGVEALEVLRDSAKSRWGSPPDLVLLDLQMPRMDGREFLREVGSDRALRTLPVVALVSSRFSRGILEREGFPPIEYMIKPIDTQQVIDVLGKVPALINQLTSTTSPNNQRLSSSD